VGQSETSRFRYRQSAAPSDPGVQLGPPSSAAGQERRFGLMLVMSELPLTRICRNRCQRAAKNGKLAKVAVYAGMRTAGS